MANWIAGAIKKPGALTKSAHAAGESPMQFAKAHKHDSGKTGQRARLAMTLSKFGEGGVVTSGDVADAQLEKVRGEKKKPFSFPRYRGK